MSDIRDIFNKHVTVITARRKSLKLELLKIYLKSTILQNRLNKLATYLLIIMKY